MAAGIVSGSPRRVHRHGTVTLHTVKEPFLLLWNICCFKCHCSFRISSPSIMKSACNTESFFPQDYHRPSVEEILENPLIANLVAEEQRRNPERRGRRIGEPEKLLDSSPVLSELKLKEIQLQEREAALKAREESLERKSGGVGGETQRCRRLMLVCERLPERRVSGLSSQGVFINTRTAKMPPAGLRLLRAEPLSPRSAAVTMLSGPNRDSPARGSSPRTLESLFSFLP